MKEVLDFIWEMYKTFVITLVTTILILMIVIGGEVTVQFNWKEAKEAFKSIFK